MSVICIIAFCVYFLIVASWFSSKPVQQAALWALLLGVLFLPELAFFKIPLLPPYTKLTVTATLIVFFNKVMGKRLFKDVRLGKGLKFFIAVALLSNIPSIATNGDPIASGGAVLPGIPIQTIFINSVYDLVSFVSMLMLGMAFASRREWLLQSLKTWFAFALVYSFLALWEVLRSPQLHVFWYGYFQHSWEQMMRDGGYRPIVFMAHALAVGLFLSMSAILAFGLRGEKMRVFGLPTKAITAIVALAVIGTKCSGAFVYFVFSALALIAKKAKIQAYIAFFCGAIAISMPVLRVLEVFPIDATLDLATQYINPDRASSLKYRFDNEKLVMDRTMLRPLWGFGGYARGNVFTEDGEHSLVLDSAWIIIFNERGFAGYLGIFGMLTWPLFWVSKGLKRVRQARDRRLLGALSMVAAVCAADLMINGLFNNFAFLFSGLLWGAINSKWLAEDANATANPYAPVPVPLPTTALPYRLPQ